MYELLKIELKNCINKVECKLIFTIVFAYCMAGFALEAKTNMGVHYQLISSACECVFLQSAEVTFLLRNMNQFFPILVSLIYAGSMLDEKRQHIAGNLIMRSGKKQYLWAKTAAVFVSAFFVFLIPLLLNLLLCYLIFPINGIDSMWLEPAYLIGVSAYFPDCMIDFWRVQCPIFYNLVYIFVYALCSGVMALLAYGVGFLVQNQKMAKMKMIAIVTFFYIIMRIIMVILEKKQYSMENYLITVQRGSIATLLVVLAYHLIPAVILIWKGIQDYDT